MKKSKLEKTVQIQSAFIIILAAAIVALSYLQFTFVQSLQSVDEMLAEQAFISASKK